MFYISGRRLDNLPFLLVFCVNVLFSFLSPMLYFPVFLMVNDRCVDKGRIGNYGRLFLTFISTNVFFVLPFKFSRCHLILMILCSAKIMN